MVTRQSIVNRVKDEKIKFIRLQFTDIFGSLKSLFI